MTVGKSGVSPKGETEMECETPEDRIMNGECTSLQYIWMKMAQGKMPLIFLMLLLAGSASAFSGTNITAYGTTFPNITNFSRSQIIQTNYIDNGNESEIVADWWQNGTVNISAKRMVAYYPFNQQTSNSTFTKDMAITPSGNGTVSGATWTASGIYGGGYSFNGIADYIVPPASVGNFTPLENFTFTVWVKKNPNYYSCPISRSKAGSVLDWGLYEVNGIIKCYGNVTSASSTLADGETAFFACTYNGTNVSIWKNGAYVASATSTHGQSSGATIGTYIGTFYGAANFNGTIDEVRIYNQSLTADEISQLYQNNMLGKTLNALGLTYSTGAVWYANITNSTTSQASQNATVSDYNITLNYTVNEYDAISYSHAANVSLYNGTTAASATLAVGTNTYSVPFTGSYPNLQFAYSVAPPLVNSTTNFTVTWNFSMVNPTIGNYQIIQTYNITSNPSGLFVCNATYPVLSLNYTIRDAQTDALVNATYTSVYVAGSGVRSNTGTSQNYSWCISPNITIAAVLSETYVASGYAPATFTRTLNATNITTTITVLMVNLSNAKQTVLKVVASPAVPVNGARITAESLTLPDTYSLVWDCTTNSAGVCVVYTIPNSQQYRYNITSSGATTTFGPEVVVCGLADATCYRTFTIGQANYIPYLNSGNVQGSCYNTTGILYCNATDSGTVITGYTLTLSKLGNETAICTDTQTGGSASLTCNIPATNNIFIFSFYGTDATGQVYPLSSGQLYGAYVPRNRWGTDGWLAALIFFIGSCFVMVFSPWLGLIIGLFSIGISAMLGFIPESVLPLMGGAIFIVAIIGFKMRV